MPITNSCRELISSGRVQKSSSLASGWAATYIGAPAVLQVNGVLLVAVAIYFLIRSHGVREI